MHRLAWIGVIVAIYPLWVLGQGIRAGLDLRFLIYEDGEATEITCDFCGHRFKDGHTELATLAVDAAEGWVEVFFLDHRDPRSSARGGLVYRQTPVASNNAKIEVAYF